MATAAFDGETEAALAQLARFLPEAERAAAREAAVYAILMTESDLSPGSATVAAWCYEYASEGIPWRQWPDLVAARAHAPDPSGSPAARAHARARRDSLAQGLTDKGEIP